MKVKRYIAGIDPTAEEPSVGVLSISNEEGEPLIVKINPKEIPIQTQARMTLKELIEQYRDILTEEDLKKLNNYKK